MCACERTTHNYLKIMQNFTLVPVQIIGKLTLNRNPDNFFAETEQVAFHPGHLVPGIDFSNDPLLQGRLFSYTDTQLSRLGSPNFHEIPINRPIAKVDNNQRDGHMRQTIVKGKVSYEPNSLGGGCPMQRMWQEGGFVSHPEPMQGAKVREHSETFADHFSQASLFWRSQAAWEKDHIVNAFCFELGKVNVLDVRKRMVSTLTQVDATLAQRVADGLGMDVPPPPVGAENVPRTDHPKKDDALSMAKTRKTTITGRKIGFLVADGVDVLAIEAMRNALEAGGATVKIIAPKSGEISNSKNQRMAVDHSLPTVGSVLFDALYVPGGQSAETLCNNAHAVLFIKEAYKHGKAIAASGEGATLITKAAHSAGAPNGEFAGPGVFIAKGKLANGAFTQTFLAGIAQHRFSDRPDVEMIIA